MTHIVHAASDHRGHRGDESRVVLVVWMDHDDNIGPKSQSLTVACLLVRAVTEVLAVDERSNTELHGAGNGRVGAGVVDQENIINDIVWDCLVRLLKRLLGLVRWKDDHDALAMQHYTTSGS